MRLLLIFQFHFYCFLLNASMENAQLSISEIDANYSKLLNLTSKDSAGKTEENEIDAEQTLDWNLKIKLEFWLFYADIQQMLERAPINNEKKRRIQERERSDFDQIGSTVPTASADAISQHDTCIVWAFWRALGDRLAENDMLPNMQVAHYVKMRSKVVMTGINCALIVDQNNFAPLPNEQQNAFLRDLYQLHFSAIIFLLHRKSQVGNAVEIGAVGQYKLWKFSKFFDVKKMENETNFAHQFRLLRLKNDAESGNTMKEIKQKLNHLIGTVVLRILEFLRPIELQIETISDDDYGTDYALMLSENKGFAAQAEIRLSIRIYFSHIWSQFWDGWHQFCSKNSAAKSHLAQLWDGDEFGEMVEAMVNCEQKSLEKVFEFAEKIMPKNRGRENGQKVTMHKGGKAGAKKKHLTNAKKNTKNLCEDNQIFETVRIQLMDRHIQFLTILATKNNMLGILLSNSLASESGALAKLRDFVSGKDFFDTAGGDTMLDPSIWVNMLTKMEQKYPSLAHILRNELTDEQIRQIQLKNYLRFLNDNSEPIVWTRAHFIITILPYYQRFKAQLNDPNLSSFQQQAFEHVMSTLEGSMDSMSVTNSVEEIEHLQSTLLKGLKTSIFLKLNSPVSKHVDTLKGLFCERDAFRILLREIDLNKERMRILLDEDGHSSSSASSSSSVFDCDGGGDSEEGPSVNKERGEVANLTAGVAPAEAQKITKSAAAATEEKETVEPADGPKKAWETEANYDEGVQLTHAYKKLLLAKKEPSDAAKHALLVNVAHYHFTFWVKQLLQALDLLKDKNSLKFTRTAIQLSIDATTMGFFEADKQQQKGNDKEAQCCYLISFILHLIDNGTLRENGDWAAFGDGFIAEIDFLRGLKEDLKVFAKMDNRWVKPKCDDPQISHALIRHLEGQQTVQCQIHLIMLRSLFIYFPDFLKYIALNSVNLIQVTESEEKIKPKELAKFYEKFLMDDNRFLGGGDQQHAILDDKEETIAILGKLLVMRAFRNEQSLAKRMEMKREIQSSEIRENKSEIEAMTAIVQQYFVAKAEMSVVFKLIQIFMAKSDQFRILCPLLDYVDYLEKQVQGNAPHLWQLPKKCFKMGRKEIDERQRKALGDEHFLFLVALLIGTKSATSGNGEKIAQILRDTPGAMFRLSILVDGTTANIQQMWEMPNLRYKLHNQNFFTNKMRLLEHYHRFFLLPVDDEFGADFRLLRQRLAADVVVWMNWLETEERPKQCAKIQQMVDELFLHFRLIYDELHQLGENEQMGEKLQHVCSTVVPAIKKFLNENRNQTLNQTYVRKEWAKLTRIFRRDEEIVGQQHQQETIGPSPEAKKDKVPPPIQHIQKLHFVEFKKLLSGEFETTAGEDGGRKEMVEQILQVIFSSKNAQQKMSAFLTESDLNEFWEAIGKTEPQAEAASEASDKSGQMEENSEKRKSKKAVKNMGKKEKNKTKTKESLENERAEEKRGETNGGKLLPKVKGEEETIQKKNDQKMPKVKGDKETTLKKENDQKMPKVMEQKMETTKVRLKDNKSEKKIENYNSDEKMMHKRKEELHQHEAAETIQGKAVGRDIAEYLEGRKQFRHSLVEEIGKINSFRDFYEDTFLYGKYEQFMQIPSMELQRIIDVGAFVNEIGHRLKAMEEMRKFNYIGQSSDKEKRMGQLKSEWEEFVKQFEGQLDEQKLEKMEKRAQQLLNCLENERNCATNELIRQLKVQIHLKNLSLALLKISEFDKRWEFYENKAKKAKMFYLLGERFGTQRFAKVKLEWQNMVDQVELDIALYGKFISKEQQNAYLSPTFAYLSQQTICIEEKSDENLEKWLEMLNNPSEEAAHGQRIREELGRIRSIVDEWSDGVAQLYISGSFLLGTRTTFSDIDLLCVVPAKVIKLANFFGDEKAFCEQNECSTGDTQSLYCRLCQHKDVNNLLKTPLGKVFLIKFDLNEATFDITFVAIPGRRTLPHLLNEETIGKYVNSFKSDQNFVHKNMLRTLSSYRSTLYIANLFQENVSNGVVPSAVLPAANDENVEAETNKLANKKDTTFRAMTLFLKIWAKKNHIYSNVYGYLNGAMLAIMVAKVILLYPTASLPFLIKKFFIFYLTRPTQVPIQLAKLKLEENVSVNENWDPFFVRRPDEQEMPAYMPMFPEQNVARLITHCAVRAIRHEMTNALNQLNGMDGENLMKHLLTEAIPFREKFKMFILVNCASAQNDRGEHFCQFVSGRIRLQIVIDIDKKEEMGKIETRLYDDIYGRRCATEGQPIAKRLALLFRPTYCRSWLIGIHSDESRGKIGANLENFDSKIKKDFLKYNYPTTNKEEKRTNFIQINPKEVEEKFNELKIELKSLILSREEEGDDEASMGMD